MKESKLYSLLFGFIFTCVLVFLDQWSKQLAYVRLAGGRDFVIIPGALELHYLENTGAAFSLLENKMFVFYILTPLLCALMVFLYARLPMDKKFTSLRWVLIFLTAGAIGNFIDRIQYQYVIDFIYVSLIHFPVFNVADIYVTCSVAVLFILILFVYSEEELSVIMEHLKFWKRNS
ncbi:MAG: signal peptidase II [Lachnospiraceae bacterium]|nr:signal peptidase II [Lachnospiraceae bacterium]